MAFDITLGDAAGGVDPAIRVSHEIGTETFGALRHHTGLAMHDVFVSHSRMHDGAIADAVVAALETQAVPCWIAPRNIEAGEDFPAAIIEAISTTRVLVLIFSSHSNGSDHIRREIATALSKKVMVVPFRVENVMPEGALEYHLQSMQWLDALTPALNHHIQELVRRVKDILRAPISAKTPTTDLRTPGRIGPSLPVGPAPTSRPAAHAVGVAVVERATDLVPSSQLPATSRQRRLTFARNVLAGVSCLVFLTLLLRTLAARREAVAGVPFSPVSEGGRSGATMQVVADKIQFFEGPSKPPIPSARQYRTTFPAAQARFIFTELTYAFAKTDHDVTLTTACAIVARNDTVVGSFALAATLTAGSTTKTSARAWGRAEPGGWSPGVYRADCTVGETLIARGTFVIKP